MSDNLQEWLGNRLGVLLDMTPQKFGRNTKDGKLLAKLLFNYGVIPLQILDKIEDCRTCYECYRNLAILRPFLEYIGVSRDDEIYQKMAGSDGSAAMKVFYDVYLNLESKDRLQYISAEKERRFEGSSCSKFKVDWVPEKELRNDPKETETPLAMPLVEEIDLIKHHEEKCKEVVEKIKAAKKRFEKISKKESKPKRVVPKYTLDSLNKLKGEAEKTMSEINKFSKKYPEPCRSLSYTQLTELKNKYENTPCVMPCEKVGKAILGDIKRRKRGEVYTQNLQKKVQHILVENLWKRIVDQQDRNFEDKVCANLLKQSQYEKQMMMKLQLIKHQKKVIEENRRTLECLKVEQQQKEYDSSIHAHSRIRNENEEEEEFEKKRISDLHRRAYDAKARMRNARLRREAEKICLALIDIAIRISEIREETGCQVPKALMKDMKELFFKDLPIFDILEHIEELYEDKPQIVNEIEFYGEGDGNVDFFQISASYEQMKCQEMERQNALDECDLNDYINLSGPWMVDLLFPDNSEAEGKHLVLGYIVHKILGLKYPDRNPHALVQIKQMKPTVIVKGLNNANALEMLTELMELCNILVVKIADVINFVLLAYKEQNGEHDFDIKISSDGYKEKIVVKEKEENKKLQLLKKTDVVKTEIAPHVPFADKQTQTPRIIPEEDNVLSSSAEIGKLAFEALGAGDPVPDPVIISAILEYLKSKQDDYTGWVLIDYPVLYSQARDLEYCLIGHYTLPVLEEMETLEDAEGFTFRGPWGDAFVGVNPKIGGNSRLVPKPDCFNANLEDVPRTYFHAFIKMIKVPATPKPSETDVGLLEKFYTEQDIFLNFEYQSLNFQTMKNLGKVILNCRSDSVSSVISKASVDCFGDGVLELNEKWEHKKKTEKTPSRGTKSVVRGTVSPLVFEMSETGGEFDMSAKDTSEEQELPIQPGEPGWEWAEGPQPEEYLIALATLWENMETVYLEDLKKVFFCLRMHRSNVLTYNTCLRQSIRKLMRRPDEKQEVLSSFQKMFNEVDPDLRPDTDVKCELHVRVSELEQALMNFADERKMNSIKDVTKVAQDSWTPDEMAHIINTYLTALQLEADRCIDSVQVIMDYYALLQQKIPEEKQLEKVIVPTILIQNGKYTITAWSNRSVTNITPNVSELKRGRTEPAKERSRTRSLADKKRRSSDACDLPNAAEVVTQILTGLELPDDSLTPFHNFFMDTVKFALNHVKNIFDNCLAETKKNERQQNTTKAGKSGKKTSDLKIMAGNSNFIAEWSSALEDEMNRFFFRAKLLLARGIFEMNEFLTTILNLLSSLTDDIREMYLKEIYSILECCKMIRCSIEEEKRVEFVLELKEDEFIVSMDEYFLSNYEDEYSSGRDHDGKFMFTVEQLALLRSKLHMVAPSGEIIKRSMVYIFQDLKMFNAEGGPVCFSKVWDDVEPHDLVEIFDLIYLNLEIVSWKDFIVYALNLPLPSENDILATRNNFRKFDPLMTELCNREVFEKVHFWFETCLAHASIADRYEKAKALLFDMYQVDENHTNYTAMLLAFCKDSNPVEGFIKALALAEGKKIKLCVSEASLVDEDAGEYLFENENFALSAWRRNSMHHCPVSVSRFEDGKVEDKELMAGEGGEGGSVYYDLPYQSSVSFVSFNILTSLLKASFPSLPQLSVLLDCSQTFQDTLNSMYDSLKPVNGKVEVDKLMKNKVIDRLIHSTNKFKFINLFSILQAEVRSRKTSVCASDRLALMKCLDQKEKVLS